MITELLRTNVPLEVKGTAASFGCRKMQRHLRSRYKLNIPRDKLMNILRKVDQEGTEIRGSRKLYCRKYISLGVDHC